MFYKTLEENSDVVKMASLVIPMTIICNTHYANSRHVVEKFGLTQSEIDLLATLHLNNGGLTAAEVSERLIFTSGGISKVVKKLESKNLIYKEVYKDDKRSYLLYNTEAGNKIIESCIPKFEAHDEKFFEVLTDKEIETIKKAFKKVIYAWAEE